MNTSIKPRLAKPEDAKELGLVHVTCWQETYTDIVPQKFLDQFNLDERHATQRSSFRLEKLKRQSFSF